jgi:hypothetical protein
MCEGSVVFIPKESPRDKHDSVEPRISLGLPLRMKTRWASAQSSFIPISSMVHIGKNRAVFEVMDEIVSPTAGLILRNLAGTSPLPPRSPSDRRSEVVRGGNGEVPVWGAGLSGARREE